MGYWKLWNVLPKIHDFVFYILDIDIIDYSVVAKGRIELPTHGFSVSFKPLLLNYIGEYELLLAVEFQSIKVKSIIIEWY